LAVKNLLSQSFCVRINFLVSKQASATPFFILMYTMIFSYYFEICSVIFALFEFWIKIKSLKSTYTSRNNQNLSEVKSSKTIMLIEVYKSFPCCLVVHIVMLVLMSSGQICVGHCYLQHTTQGTHCQ